jgi:hypothetical protein
MPNDMDRAYVAWTGRKATTLRRPTLDCGHKNTGQVFYHAWCDRLSCSDECANADHDCSKFAGVKSSSEKGSEPVEPRRRPPGCVCPEDMPENAYQSGCPTCEALAVALLPPELCRGCGVVPPHEASESRMCLDCLRSPICGNRRVFGDREAVCMRPAGHSLPCGEGRPRGYQWVITASDGQGEGAPDDRVAESFRSEVRRQGLAPCEIQIDGRTEWLPAGDVTVMPADQFDALVATLDDPDEVPALQRAFWRRIWRRR